MDNKRIEEIRELQDRLMEGLCKSALYNLLTERAELVALAERRQQDIIVLQRSLEISGVAVDELSAEKERLREALEFYATGEHYKAPVCSPARAMVTMDGGRVARVALAGQPKEDKKEKSDG